MLALLAAAAAAVPTVDCARRAEPSPPPPTADRWVIAGPVAWAARHPGVSERERSVVKKSGVSVDAGSVVTVRVITRGAALIYRHKTKLAEHPRDADRVLRFRPCPPETENFSDDGRVGPRTGFAGAIIATRRMCVRVRVSRDGRSWIARLPVGRRCT